MLGSARRRFDWTRAAIRAMDVVVDPVQIAAAIDEAANALQSAVLLAAQIEADQHALRRAIDRAARALVALTRKTDPHA
jgi:hypothetical protein